MKFDRRARYPAVLEFLPMSLTINIGKRSVPALLTFLMSVSAMQAQEMHRHDPAEKLGQVNFPISCNAVAQKQFNRALALQHSFQYSEAEKAFSEVSTTDAACAM